MADPVLINIAPHQQEGIAVKRNQGSETAQSNRSRLSKFVHFLERVIRSPCVIIPSKVLFAFSVIARFVSLIFFTTYDTMCIIFEQASVVDCHQDGIIPDPETWIIVWMALSVTSSVLFVFIVVDNKETGSLNFQKEKAKKLFTKGSFISLFLLLGLTTIYYIIRTVIVPFDLGMAISVIMCFWPSAMVLALVFLNYTPRVHWRTADRYSPSCCCSEDCCSARCCPFLAKNMLFLFYWIALIMYFLETTCVWLAVALDAAHEVAPLIERKFPDESSRYKGILILLLGFSLAFHSRILSFSWQKMFHGDKDHFSEPCSKLIDGQTGPTNTREQDVPTSTNADRPPEAKATTPERSPTPARSSSKANSSETKSAASTSKNEHDENDPQVFSTGFGSGQETEKLLQS